jgi:uncharacterized RDD family membrane protein YckC
MDGRDEAMRPALTPPEMAGFWRRLFAFVLDSILLGIAGSIIAAVFYNQLVMWGPYGRVIGFPIAFLYFGLFDSAGFGGGSPGKKALGLRVVSRNGETISRGRSFWRTLAYLVPVYLNGMNLSFLSLNPQQSLVALTAVTFLVFGVSGASVYLYFANWRTRQVMHDLAAGTFVVRSARADAPVTQHINRLHVILIALWLISWLAAVPLATRYAPPDLQQRFGNAFGINFSALTKIQRALLTDPHILAAGVATGSSMFHVNGEVTSATVLTVTVIWRGVPPSPEVAANEIAENVLDTAPDNIGRQRLVVIVRHGFDIGIAQGWQSNGYVYSPDEWRAKIRAARPGEDT